MFCCHLAVSKNYLNYSLLLHAPGMFIQTFSLTVLIFTYLSNVPPSNSGGGTDGKSQMNNLMKS